MKIFYFFILSFIILGLKVKIHKGISNNHSIDGKGLRTCGWFCGKMDKIHLSRASEDNSTIRGRALHAGMPFSQSSSHMRIFSLFGHSEFHFGYAVVMFFGRVLDLYKPSAVNSVDNLELLINYKYFFKL